MLSVLNLTPIPTPALRFLHITRVYRKRGGTLQWERVRQCRQQYTAKRHRHGDICSVVKNYKDVNQSIGQRYYSSFINVLLIESKKAPSCISLCSRRISVTDPGPQINEISLVAGADSSIVLYLFFFPPAKIVGGTLTQRPSGSLNLCWPASGLSTFGFVSSRLLPGAAATMGDKDEAQISRTQPEHDDSDEKKNETQLGESGLTKAEDLEDTSEEDVRDPDQADTTAEKTTTSFWQLWTWKPAPARYDPANPPKFTTALNLLFAFVSNWPRVVISRERIYSILVLRVRAKR